MADLYTHRIVTGLYPYDIVSDFSRSEKLEVSLNRFGYDPLITPSKANIWRVQVPDWLDQMQAWDTRPFGDSRHDGREVTPEIINKAVGLPPVLWLEELDKWKYTETRANYLFRLVDAVYRRGGLIVASTNKTPGQLEDLCGEPIYRRIAGTGEPDEDQNGFKVWDLFEAVAKKKPGAA
jgi:hypothetical protein